MKFFGILQLNMTRNELLYDQFACIFSDDLQILTELELTKKSNFHA